MAFIYEVNGQRIEFDKEPTDADIDEAAASLGTTAKKKPESRMPKPVEGEGGAAFGVYRPAGRRPESQQDREASAEMGLQTARGIASNIPAVAGIPGSIVNAVANAPRTAQMVQNRVASVQSQLAGNERQPEPELPDYNQVTPYDMGYFANLTPGPQPTSPQGQLAFGAGQLVGAPVAPAFYKGVPVAAKAGYEFAKEAAPAVKGFAEGAGGVLSSTIAKPGAVKPEVWQKPSSRIKADETHYPADLQEQWRRGEISTDEINKGRISWTEEQKRALERTEGHVPVENQVARAAGEQFMDPLMSPRGWIPELAAGALGGLTFGPAGAVAGGAGALGLKAYNAYKNVKQIGAFNELGKVGFTPQTAAEMEALRTGAPHPVAGPVMPPQTPPQPAANYPLTVQGPGAPVAPSIIPMGGPQRNVNIEGQGFTLPNQIDVSNSQAARPQPIQPVKTASTPKQVSMEVAASKIQPAAAPVPKVPASAPVKPTPLVPEAIVEEVRPHKALSEQELKSKLDETKTKHEATAEERAATYEKVKSENIDPKLKEEYDDLIWQKSQIKKEIDARPDVIAAKQKVDEAAAAIREAANKEISSKGKAKKNAQAEKTIAENLHRQHLKEYQELLNDDRLMDIDKRLDNIKDLQDEAHMNAYSHPEVQKLHSEQDILSNDIGSLEKETAIRTKEAKKAAAKSQKNEVKPATSRLLIKEPKITPEKKGKK